MSLYIKAKLVFESLCLLFYLSVGAFVLFQSPCSRYLDLVLMLTCIVGVFLCVFSIGSIKDRISPTVQTNGFTGLGILFIISVSVGIYFSFTNKCSASFFLYIFSGIECVRVFDLIVCVKPYTDYTLIDV